MSKTITIDVPDEVEKILRSNPELKDIIRKEFIKKIVYSEIEKGSISGILLDLITGEEDIAMENEEKILETLREKAKKRLNDN